MTNLTPHDRFFRSAMSNPNVAREFFAYNLPAHIKSLINFEILKLQKESLIDDKLRLQITDLLFKTEFNNKSGYIYLLVEHQSSPNKLMAFRILKYMVSIMDHHLKINKTAELPIIYPMVFYNGKNHYSSSPDLFELFSDSALAQDIFLKPYHLIDLTKTNYDSIRAFLYYGILAKTMKNIFAPNFLQVIKATLIQDLKCLENQNELDYIYTILSYIFEAGNIIDYAEYKEIIQSGLSKVDEEKIMTLAEIFLQKGKKEGLQQGKSEGLQEGKLEGVLEASLSIAFKMLQQGLQIQQIVDCTGLSVEKEI